MPLIKHQISPIYLSRRPPPFAEDETGGEPPPPGDSDLRGVANLTLCGVLRQMGSLMQAAKNIEREITLDLEQVVARVEKLSEKLHGLTVKVETFNPRDVPLPEDDLRSFSKRTLHFRSTTHSLPPPTTDIPPSINSSSSCLSTPRVTFFPCSVQPTSTSSMDRRVLKKRVIALQTPGGTPTPLNCSLNSTMNFSSVTVHANTTASTLDAINSMNVASSIFGGSEGLFTKDNRPVEVRSLYTGAGNDSPLSHMRAMGLKRCDGVRSSKYYSCQPVTIGNTIKREKSIRLNLDIETRRPASFDALRDWCSDDEAPYHPLLDPVSPVVDRSRQIVSPSPSSGCDQDSPTLSHKLPRPEQLFKLLSAKYPPEVVSIDVSGGGFRRMETVRQSLCQYDYVKTKRRRKRVKRRNTIADSRDARKASLSQSAAKRRLNQTLDQPSTSSGRGLSSSPSEGYYFTDGPSFDPSFDTSEPCDSSVSSKRLDHKELRSGGVQFDFKSTSALTSRDLFKRTNTFRDESIEAIVEASTPECSNSVTTTALVHTPARQREECTGSSSGNWSASSSVRNSVELESQQTKATKRVTDDETLVEVIDRLSLSTHNNNLPDSNTSTPQLSDRNLSATAQPSDREDSSCQQSDRTLTPTSCLHCHEFCEECSPQTPLTHSPSAQRHSSSPDSPPSGSLVCPSHSRTTDGLPSYTSDGTLTPTQDIQEIPSFDDDTSSAYSCDTEGYYTSFHLDSGIRSASEDKLMSSGSVGTITSNSSVASLGTVVMRNPEKKTPPKPPQRVSSLDRKNSGSNRESIITVIHVNGSAGSSREDVTKSVSEAVDSGRETSSSANDPNSPRTLSVTSPEADGSSDCDTSERKDSFRSKTAINASGIPSMCVITPPLSDDESVRSAQINTSARTSEDPSLGSVAAKALLFQGTNNSSAPNTVRQVPRIETGKVSPHSNNSSGGSTPVSKQDSKNQSKTLFHSTSVDYSVNVRPSAMKQSDITRRLSADITPTAAPSPQPKILKVPPPPPPREDSIDSSSRRIDGNEQPISAVPPTVKQNLVITPTNSLERKKLKSSGAHVTLDSEGKVVYSSDSLQRRKKAQQQDAYKQQQNVSSNLSNIQQMPLPAPPADNTAEVTALQQQQLQQQLLQQQQIQQQQQAYMLQQEQEEKLMKQRQEEMMLSRAVQEQIVQSKQEMIHQQNSLKQQHQELQQQLAETRIELQRQQQEQQQKLQALRERQAYLQSKTPAAKQSTLERNKGQKQSLKESNKDVAKQQQALKTQELQRQTLIEQQKQIQLAEQQKQVQLQKQQQQQLLQQQQQYLQQQYQQQQQAIYGQRQDPYLFPTVPQTNSGGGALSQIPPIVPPPPPADSRQLSESSGVIMAASGNPMSPRSQRAAAGAYVHMTDQTQGAMPTNNMSVQGFTQMQQQQQLQMQQARMQQQQQYPSRPHSSQGLYGPTSERGQTARSSTPVQGATVSSSPRHSPAVPPPPVGATPQQIAMHHSQLRANAGTDASALVTNSSAKITNSQSSSKSASKGKSKAPLSKPADKPLTQSKESNGDNSFLASIIKTAKSPLVNKKNSKSKLNQSKDSDDSLTLSLGSESYTAGTCVDDIPPTPSPLPLTTDRVFAALAHAQLGNSNHYKSIKSSNSNAARGIHNNPNTVTEHVTASQPDSIQNKHKSILSNPSTNHSSKHKQPNPEFSNHFPKVRSSSSSLKYRNRNNPATNHRNNSSSSLRSNSATSLKSNSSSKLKNNSASSLKNNSSSSLRNNSSSNIKNISASNLKNSSVSNSQGSAQSTPHYTTNPMTNFPNSVMDFSNSSFQRNNSYRLATLPLSEASNKRSSANNLVTPLAISQSTNKNIVHNPPMLNDIPLHGPRIIVQKENTSFNRNDGMYNSMPRNKKKLGGRLGNGTTITVGALSTVNGAPDSSLTKAQASNRLIGLQKRMGLSVRDGGVSAMQLLSAKPRVVASIPKQSVSTSSSNSISSSSSSSSRNEEHVTEIW